MNLKFQQYIYNIYIIYGMLVSKILNIYIYILIYIFLLKDLQ